MFSFTKKETKAKKETIPGQRAVVTTTKSYLGISVYRRKIRGTLQEEKKQHQLAD